MQLIKSLVFTSLFSLLFYSSAAFAQQWGDFTYTESGGTITITDYTCPGGAAVIPDTIDGKPVVRIGNQAFFQCAALTGVTIPGSVTSIGFAAFNGCTGLTTVTIPDNVTSLEQGAFYGCTGLSSVTMGTGLTTIGYDAFNGCTGLTGISIPGSVTTISGSAFQGCTGLTSIAIPGSVTSMGNSVFYNCTGLTSVSIPSSLTSIPDYTFYGCTGLTTVTIPDSIISIGTAAFFHCSALSAAYFNGNAPTIGDHIFVNTASGFTVYYNAGSTGFDNPWCIPNNPCYPTTFCTDADHDGYSIEGGGCGAIDCNDNNSSVNPGASDANCDGIDNNCNGQTDEGYISVPTTCGAGACAGNTGSTSCVAGSVVDSCDPFAGATADTNCDGIDNNCNGQTDEGYVIDSSCFLPGACAAGNVASSCTAGVETPCATGTPSSDANCDGIDNNCNGQTDEGYISVPTACGVGACAGNTGSTTCVAGSIVDSCDPFAGATADTNCDGIDNNCNGQTDEGYVIDSNCFLPGACAAGNVASSCTGGVETPCATGTPSSDANCDGIDNNCNGQTDEGYVSVPTACGVGACAAAGSTSCVAGQVDDSCTPGSSTAEVCNGIDDDCDGEIDNGLVFKTYYRDADNDTYGNADNATVACEEPEGYVDNSTGFDCNDNDAAVNPGETEVCGDGIDNNCNGQIDENCTTDNCTDADADGYFAGEGCTPFDCDDNDWKIHEGCEAAPCSLKIIPKQIFKLLAFVEPVVPYIIIADKDSGINFGTFSVRFPADGISPLPRIRIGKRIIIGSYLVNPFKVEQGEATAEVEIYGVNPQFWCAGFTVK